MKNAFRQLKRTSPNSHPLLKSFQRSTFLNRIKSIRDRFGLHTSTIQSSGALLDTNLIMYSKAREFRAFLTKNAYDMSIHNESDSLVHSNFGTIDNPNLIFGAGTTWRMVACTGPGSEEESSSHEKMYFIVREGPIHRCSFCGQCYKLVKLKDDITSDDNLYYQSAFTDISNDTLGHNEYINTVTFPYVFNDLINSKTNPFLPKNRAWVFVNNDEADHLFVDPAYRMKFYSDMETEALKRHLAIQEVERQYNLAGLNKEKIVIAKDVYETWIKIELDILQFDRCYNRYEKFAGRKLFDPVNHDRREKRMLQRQYERQVENYTFYSGGLTEEEQKFRDYYESDLEEFKDEETINKHKDETLLANIGEMDFNKYTFIESSTYRNEYAPVEDFVDQLLFKYKYRKITDPKYFTRHQRQLKRFNERLSKNTKSSELVKDLGDKLEEIHVKSNYFYDVSALENDILPHAEFISKEGLQQFNDYYESDLEDGTLNKDMLEDLNEREKLRFAECFVNEYSKNAHNDKYYLSIPKRPFNEKKSIVHNFVEDLIDFNYRVKPIARNLSFKDTALRYQATPVQEDNTQEHIFENDSDRYRKILSIHKPTKKH